MSTLRQRAPLDLTAVSFGREGSTSAYMTFSLQLCPEEKCSLFGKIKCSKRLSFWLVCSIISYTHWNKGYRKVFSLITTVLDYSASARERQMTKLSLIDKILVTKNSLKHVQCFYQVKETRVHVGEREMLWEQKPTGLFPQLFLVLPNSHNSISITR